MSKELTTTATKGIAVSPDTSGANVLMSMIEKAVSDPSFDVAKLNALLDVRERWEKEAARKAFAVALADFKENAPPVFKSSQVKYKTDKGETNYKHASLGNASAVLGKHLSKYGLSHRWTTSQKDGKMSVTCILTHSLGHSESVTLEGPYDQSGGKNAIQAIMSAKTYLERHSLFSVTGTASQDEDDDGKGAGKPATAIPGPTEAKAKPAPKPASKPVTGSTTVQILGVFKSGDVFKVKGELDYFTKSVDDANSAKALFKDGDAAQLDWTIDDKGVCWITKVDRAKEF